MGKRLGLGVGVANIIGGVSVEGLSVAWSMA